MALGTVRVPATGLPAAVTLVAQGPTPGSRGAEVPFRLENNALVFELTPQLHGRWIYLVPKPAQ